MAVADLLVQNEGTIFLLTPVTEAGEAWVGEYIARDAQTWGAAIVVEHRYIDAIIDGAVADGLEVQ